MTANILTLDHPANRKPEIVWEIITVEVAQKYLGANNGNRNIRAGHVHEMARDIAAGRWISTGDSIKFDYNGRLIDGQHRLLAVIEAGQPIGTLVARNLQPEARSVVDTNARRSAGDALKFNGFTGQYSLVAAVAKIALRRDAGGIRYAFSSDSSRFTNSEILDWVEANGDVESAVALATRTSRSIGVRPSIWAYALLVLERANGPAAIEFATSLAEFRTTGVGDPRLALLNIFRLAQAGNRRNPQNPEQLYIIFRTWNAWRAGEKLKTINPAGNGSAKGARIPAVSA